MSSRVLESRPRCSAKNASVSASLSGARLSMKEDQASISHGERGVLEWAWTHSSVSPSPFAGCQFLQQGIGIEAKKLHQALVGWGIVYIFAIFPGECRPALVEHACQNHVIAQTNAKAPGWALSQINKEMLSFHIFLVLK
jgi:hypothetical protein